MNCPECNKPLKVTHTYNAGGSARTHRAVCDNGHVSVIVSEIALVDPTHGQGASALARKIKTGGWKVTRDMA